MNAPLRSVRDEKDPARWHLVDSGGRMVGFRLTAEEAEELTAAVNHHRRLSGALRQLVRAVEERDAFGVAQAVALGKAALEVLNEGVPRPCMACRMAPVDGACPEHG